MAPEHWTDQLTPEERCAVRLVERLKLVPPIDIEAVVRQFADVEYDQIPGEADALLLYADKGHPRHLVIVDSRPTKFRQRFTLAHELAHVCLPWHVGELVYKQDAQGANGGPAASVQEAEANRFASEVLIPRPWLVQTIKEHTSIGKMVGAIRHAEVSIEVANWALTKVLEGPFVMAEVDSSLEVKRVKKGPGTAAKPPSTGSFLDMSEYSSVGATVETVPFSGRQFVWWRFPGHSNAASTKQLVESKTLLVRILRECGIHDPPASKEYSSISAITGGIWGKYKTDSESRILALFRQRFANCKYAYARHASFPAYLESRARELSGKLPT